MFGPDLLLRKCNFSITYTMGQQTKYYQTQDPWPEVKKKKKNISVNI